MLPIRCYHRTNTFSLREERLIYVDVEVPQEDIRKHNAELQRNTAEQAPDAESREQILLKDAVDASQRTRERLQKVTQDNVNAIYKRLKDRTPPVSHENILQFFIRAFGNRAEVTPNGTTGVNVTLRFDRWEQNAPQDVAIKNILDNSTLTADQKTAVRAGLETMTGMVPENRRPAFLELVRTLVNDPAKLTAMTQMLPQMAMRLPAVRRLTAAELANPATIRDEALKQWVTGLPADQKQLLDRLVPLLAQSNNPGQNNEIPEQIRKQLVDKANADLRAALGDKDVAILSEIKKNRIKGKVMMSHGVEVVEEQEGGRTVFKAVAPTEKWGKLMNHIMGFVLFIGSFKAELKGAMDRVTGNSNAPGSYTEELPENATPLQRAQRDGRTTIMNYTGGPRPERVNETTFVIRGNVGESWRTPGGNDTVTITFRWNNNQWEWKDGGSDSQNFVPAGQSPYYLTPRRADDANYAITPEQVALRQSWNTLGEQLAKINTVAREAPAKQEMDKKNNEARLNGIAALDSALKRYQDYQVGDRSLPPLPRDLSDRIESKKKQINSLPNTGLNDEQRKILASAEADLQSLRTEVFRAMRKEGGALIASSPSSYGNGIAASHIVGAYPRWTVDIDGNGHAGDIRIYQVHATGEWRIAFKHSPHIGSTKWPSTSVMNFRSSSTMVVEDTDGAGGTVTPANYFTNITGAAQADSVVQLLKRLQEETPLA